MFQYPKTSLSVEKVLPMHQSSVSGVEDMSMLGDLHEAAILLNLHQRYQQGNIYVSAELNLGSVADKSCLSLGLPLYMGNTDLRCFLSIVSCG